MTDRVTVKVTDEFNPYDCEETKRLMNDLKITPEIADRLESLIGLPSDFLIRLEANYRMELELEPYSKSAIKAISPWATVIEVLYDRGGHVADLKKFLKGDGNNDCRNYRVEYACD